MSLFQASSEIKPHTHTPDGIGTSGMDELPPLFLALILSEAETLTVSGTKITNPMHGKLIKLKAVYYHYSLFINIKNTPIKKYQFLAHCLFHFGTIIIIFSLLVTTLNSE